MMLIKGEAMSCVGRGCMRTLYPSLGFAMNLSRKNNVHLRQFYVEHAKEI